MTVAGFGTKTTSVALYANTRQYNISNNKTFGLPADAMIYNIIFRASGRTVNNQLLTGLMNDAYLFLKDSSGGFMLDAAPITNYIQKNTTSDETAYPPFRADQVDWTNSYVAFANPAAIQNGEAFELTVFYYRTSQQEEVKTLANNIGIKSPTVRTSSLVVNSQVGKQVFNLAFQSLINIPDMALVLGFTIQDTTGMRTLDGKEIIDLPQRQASFLTLKKKGTYLLLDSMPIETKRPGNSGFQYFPIEPTLSCEIDWETSFIYCSNSAVIENKNYLITFYWQSDERGHQNIL